MWSRERFVFFFFFFKQKTAYEMRISDWSSDVCSSDLLDSRETRFRETVRDLTDGRGADVVFDPIGGAVFHESLRALAVGGKLVTIGYASGEIPQIGINLLLLKNIGVTGFNWGEYVGWGPVDERKR